jgi:predicted HTH transcriptional regulator
VIGVEDASRRVKGLPDVLKEEERLASIVSDGIQPRLVPEIEVLGFRRTQVLAVKVYPSSLRPHCLARLGPDKGVYVRIGSTNRPAGREITESLRREVRLESYDEQPLPRLNSEAIDFRAASECFAPVRRLVARDLRTLRLVVAHQGRHVPTIGGVLLFGKTRARDFPDAWLQAGAFAGRDRSRIDDSQEFHRHLPLLVEDALSFSGKHLRRGVSIRGSRSVSRTEIPPVAVREAVVNALVHADYSQRGSPVRIAVFDDRLEVENPGLLPMGLTVEEAVRGVSIIRNRVLARFFKELGLIEQWGGGFQRMIAACREAGLPDPGFEELGTHFRVTLWRKGGPVRAELDARDLAILKALKKEGGLATHQVAKHLGLSERAARTRLAALVASGRIVESGTSAKDPRKKYLLAAGSR